MQAWLAAGVAALVAVLRARRKRSPEPTTTPTPQPTTKHTDVYASVPHSVTGLGGLAELSTAVKAARAAAPAGATTLFTINGDFLGGSAMAEHFHGQHMVDVLEAAGVDVCCIGNHEFDYGDAVLRQHIAATSFPWLACNVFDASGRLFAGATPTMVVDLPTEAGNTVGVKLGLFGVCTEKTPEQSYPDKGTTFAPVVEAAVGATQGLEAAGCQVVVGLTHVALRHDVAIAEGTPESVVALLGGHDHSPFAQVDGGSLVFKAGQNAYHLGVVDVSLTVETGPGGAPPAVVGRPVVGWSMVPVAGVAPDPAVAAIIDAYAARYDKEASGVGEFPAELPLVTMAGALDTRTSTVRCRESAVCNLVADAMAWHFGADVGVINGGFVRGDKLYSENTVWTVGDLAFELPFPKEALLLSMSGQDLQHALAEMLALWPAPTGAFPNVSTGCSLTYDEAVRGHSRVTSLTVNGSPVDPSAKYTVAVTTFMAMGGDGAVSWKNGVDVSLPGTRLRVAKVVLKYLQARQGPLPAEVEGRVVSV